MAMNTLTKEQKETLLLHLERARQTISSAYDLLYRRSRSDQFTFDGCVLCERELDGAMGGLKFVREIIKHTATEEAAKVQPMSLVDRVIQEHLHDHG
jgi:hypothetical protein